LDVHFPRYHTTKTELLQFKNILNTFQQLLPFEAETDVLLENWEFCYERSIGCLGNLRLMLLRAVRAAMETNEKTLSLGLLEKHAFSEAELFEMMQEAYEGEKELAPKPEQGIKLREMLGLYSFGGTTKQRQASDVLQEMPPVEDVQNTEIESGANTNPTIDESAKAPKKTKVRNTQPGQRNPKRDKTGQATSPPEGK